VGIKGRVEAIESSKAGLCRGRRVERSGQSGKFSFGAYYRMNRSERLRRGKHREDGDASLSGIQQGKEVEDLRVESLIRGATGQS